MISEQIRPRLIVGTLPAIVRTNPAEQTWLPPEPAGLLCLFPRLFAGKHISGGGEGAFVDLSYLTLVPLVKRSLVREVVGPNSLTEAGNLSDRAGSPSTASISSPNGIQGRYVVRGNNPGRGSDSGDHGGVRKADFGRTGSWPGRVAVANAEIEPLGVIGAPEISLGNGGRNPGDGRRTALLKRTDEPVWLDYGRTAENPELTTNDEPTSVQPTDTAEGRSSSGVAKSRNDGRRGFPIATQRIRRIGETTEKVRVVTQASGPYRSKPLNLIMNKKIYDETSGTGTSDSRPTTTLRKSTADNGRRLHESNRDVSDPGLPEDESRSPHDRTDGPSRIETGFDDPSNINRIVDRLYSELEDKMRIERERRGIR